MFTDLISELKVMPVKSKKSKIKARGRATIKDVMDINFTVRDGKDGLWVCLPSHLGKDPDGNDKWYKDMYIKEEADRDAFNKMVLDAFENMDSEQGSASGPSNQVSDDSIPF